MKRNLALVSYEDLVVDPEPVEEFTAAVEVQNGLRLCAARNCGARAATYSPYCRDCCAELEALQQYEVERAWRRQERLEKLEKLFEVWMVFWDWQKRSLLVGWILTAFVIVGWTYVAGLYSTAVIEWLKQCAGIQ